MATSLLNKPPEMAMVVTSALPSLAAFSPNASAPFATNSPPEITKLAGTSFFFMFCTVTACR